MRVIEITTQNELDCLPERFEEYTRIIIKSEKRLIVRKAWGNSSVEAWENSSVEAWGNSSVVAWSRVSVQVFSEFSPVVLFGFAVAIASKILKHKISKKSKNAHIQIVDDADWFENHGIETKRFITLYKRVSEDYKTQEGESWETTWRIGSVLEHPSWNPKGQECGSGKFHACPRPYFCDEFRSLKNDRYIAIRIYIKDLYAWPNPSYPHKIAFRKGKVLCECDRFGKEIKQK
jgi:hypothetical protein